LPLAKTEPEREKARDGFRRYVDTQMEIVRNSCATAAVRAGMARLSRPFRRKSGQP
jgi:hypothetical protein